MVMPLLLLLLLARSAYASGGLPPERATITPAPDLSKRASTYDVCGFYWTDTGCESLFLLPGASIVD